jgi:folate-binding protein YgfZ
MSQMISKTNTYLFKPSLKNASDSAPIQWSWVTLIGPDAKDFLHRLTTVHVRELQVGQGKPGCFLTSLGKIRAYFKLWHYRTDEYAFEFDAGQTGKWKNDLLAAIDQFTFAEKMTLTDVSSTLESVWIFPSETDMPRLGLDGLSEGQTMAIDEELRVSHHGSSDYGRPWITVWGRTARLSQWVDLSWNQAQEATFQEIEKWRIESLRPRVDHELTEDVLPLEIGLREAIAEQKGCYPGQEVIEKIISLGSPPKRLVRIEGTSATPQPGDPILNLSNPPVEIGRVTSVTSSSSDHSSNAPRNFIALGIVKKIHAKDGLPVQFQTSAQGKIMQVSL